MKTFLLLFSLWCLAMAVYMVFGGVAWAITMVVMGIMFIAFLLLRGPR